MLVKGYSQVLPPVTGKIHSQKVERDGDVHLMIAVDGKFRYLLTPGNYISKCSVKTSGYLVAEVVCQGQPKFQPAIAACQPKAGTYLHPISIPPDGTHVCITGSLVHDKMHPPQYPKGWAEIHQFILFLTYTIAKVHLQNTSYHKN